jgi:protease IV
MDMAERRSIFGSVARAFFGSLFGVLGVFLGIVVIFVIIGLLALGGGKEMDGAGRHKVLPNPDWSQKELTHSSPILLYVNVKGIIGTDKMRPDEVRGQLERSQLGAFEGRVHGVLLDINTPGGGAFASDEIYRVVKEYKERFKVPVYAYTDGLCASGGFYIACAADKVFASGVSLIGSVGVVSNFINIYEALEKIGVKPLTLTAGKNKDMLNPLREWEDNEDAEMKLIVNHFYDDFLDVVVGGRPKLTREKLVNEYGAKVFPSPLALEYGYIDGISSSRGEVISKLASAAGVDGQGYQVVELVEKSWLDEIVRGEHPLLSGKIKHKVEIPGYEPLPEGYLYLYRER